MKISYKIINQSSIYLFADLREYKNCDFKIEELEDRLELGAWIGGDGGDGGQGGSSSGDGGDGGDAGDGGKGNTGVETIKK